LDINDVDQVALALVSGCRCWHHCRIWSEMNWMKNPNDRTGRRIAGDDVIDCEICGKTLAYLIDPNLYYLEEEDHKGADDIAFYCPTCYIESKDAQ